MPSTHRTVIEDPRFAQELQQIQSNPHKADEIVDGAKWVLARDPYAGTQLAPKSSVWFIPIEQPADEPKTSIYYAFDDNTVRLLSIRQQKSKAGPVKP